MSARGEAGAVAAIIEYLLYRGCLVIRVNSGAVQPKDNGGSRFIAFNRWQARGLPAQTAGVADILALAGGQFFVIEVKAPGRRHKTTEAQRRFLAECAARGAVCVIACGIEDVERALEAVEVE